ncbi:MBL fold metallo-hydrolase [Paraferrimonas haliotis]|uniref:Cyclase n=1 Tax=Paraferrimonas haliotis TaxID=2013866 RepID=A0AA37TMI6_9GAMM|nr:MBL fold metallo-hydrolase [Paraferrimonas haliotis]GLS84172.1 cyclase [Paraferrimonas haliotis]
MKNQIAIITTFVTAASFAFISPQSSANEDRFAKVTITTEPLTESIYMLTGAGGNIGVSAGEDGILIIDDQYAPLADKISKALEAIQPGTPKYVINTHHHGDHTGGNLHFSHGATIMAHDNVRRHLHADNQPKAALPVVTYDKGIKVHFNGDTIDVQHFGTGHTDGDSLIFWQNANVIHMGDQYFQGRFPYVDLGNGGNVNGYLANVRKVIAMIDDNTKIIPGHGKLSTKAELTIFANMIEQTQAYVQQQKQQGKSVEELVAEGLPAQWKDWSWAFITEEKWIKTLYQ